MNFVDLLLENLPDMIFVKEAKSLRFVRFNKAGEQLIGVPREKLIGKTDYDFFPKSEADFFTSQDREVLETGERRDIPEEPIHTASGVRILHTKKIPVYDSDGKPLYLLGISEDITERKRAEEVRTRLEIEKRNVAIRDEFISIASHELRTPLTPLKLQIQLLRRGLYESPQGIAPGFTPSTTAPATYDSIRARQQGLLRAAEESVDRLTQLIDGLLDVSRITAGRLVPRPASVDLRDLVVSVVERFRLQLERSFCAFEIRASTPVFGEWDASQIERIIVNLLTNAMKFGRGKPIRISVGHEDGDRIAVVKVTDQGRGIDPEDHERIFQRFERAVPEAHYGGLGLGLYISREIALAHHGTLSVESEPGKGSTFVLRLPARAIAEGRAAA